MTILHESPWYQEILKEGWLKGQQEGWQKGRLEQARQNILYLLATRFTAAHVQPFASLLEKCNDLDLLQTLLVSAAQASSLTAFQERLWQASRDAVKRSE